MFHYIKGKVTMKFDGGIVLENGGIGYELHVPENSSMYLSDGQEIITVFTVMIVREDDVSIYGFSDKESLNLFRKLMTVNGVGAKAAMAILSSMPVQEIQKAIIFDDSATLTKANGIGKKIAQRITLELKDKVGAISGITEMPEQVVIEGSQKVEAMNALISLGYSKSEATEAMASVSDDGLTTEEYIKRALKGMGR